MKDFQALEADFSFMKTMVGKDYNEIIKEKPILHVYMEQIFSPEHRNRAINILKNESQALFLHEGIVPTIYTSDGNMAVVESEGKLFVAYFDEEEDKVYEYYDTSKDKPIPYIIFIRDYN